MSKSRMVNSDFWNDPWVVDHLNPLDCLLFMYLFTNSHCNVAGIYEISLRTISSEIGIEKEELARMLKRLEPKVHYRDSWIVLVNGIKHQNYRSPKMKAAIDKLLTQVPPELIDLLNWPEDYGAERPKGTMQTQLLDVPNDQVLATSSQKRQKLPTRQNELENDSNRGDDTVLIPYTYLRGNDNYNDNDNSNGNKSTNVDLAASAMAVKTRSADIDEMLEYWESTVGYPITAKLKYNRFAISNLLKKYGKAKLKRIVNGVVLAKKDKFAPRIADYSQLQGKMNELMSWGHSSQTAKSKHGWD